MPRKKSEESIDSTTSERIESSMALVLGSAEKLYNSSAPEPAMSQSLKESLDFLTEKSAQASTAFTNIVTSLAIKCAFPSADIRYHQVQIQNETDRPAGFAFRPVSEKLIYPWLHKQNFEGAKSGWQTRTFERPKPYMTDFAENIGIVKTAFLNVYDRVEVHGENAMDALTYLLIQQMRLREAKRIVLSLPKTRDIEIAISLFSKHFFYPYKNSKGASRLPVLALYAIYNMLLKEIARYEGMGLKPLQEHSAADSQTGSAGDIEVEDLETRELFEVVEVKHNIPVSDHLIEGLVDKIMDKSIRRYYVLTTSSSCTVPPESELRKEIQRIESIHDCQIIVNGLIPTLRYYMRLLRTPSSVFESYVKLLQEDKSVAHEHRTAWNTISR